MSVNFNTQPIQTTEPVNLADRLAPIDTSIRKLAKIIFDYSPFFLDPAEPNSKVSSELTYIVTEKLKGVPYEELFFLYERLSDEAFEWVMDTMTEAEVKEIDDQNLEFVTSPLQTFSKNLETRYTPEAVRAIKARIPDFDPNAEGSGIQEMTENEIFQTVRQELDRITQLFEGIPKADQKEALYSIVESISKSANDFDADLSHLDQILDLVSHINKMLFKELPENYIPKIPNLLKHCFGSITKEQPEKIRLSNLVESMDYLGDEKKQTRIDEGISKFLTDANKCFDKAKELFLDLITYTGEYDDDDEPIAFSPEESENERQKLLLELYDFIDSEYEERKKNEESVN